MRNLAPSVGLMVLTVLAASRAIAARDDLTRIETAIDGPMSKRQFMGAVLIARNGQIRLNKGYGHANLEWRIPNSPDARFRLASMTKQFTAACILLLQERGQLKIEDPISKYLPDMPPSWKPITVFNLLTHTSGIHELTALPDFDASEPFATTPEKLVARFRAQPLDFIPGTDFRYSNSGYILLGYLIEKVTGKTYRQFVQTNLFDRLNMKDSGYDSTHEIISRHAEGYVLKPDGLQIADYIDMTVPFAAGGLYSTTGDLLRWHEGLFGGKLLSAASLARMQLPFKRDYAFGLAVDLDEGGSKVIWHCGAVEGFGSCAAYVPSEKLSVIILSNIEGPAARALMLEILKIEKHEPLMWKP